MLQVAAGWFGDRYGLVRRGVVEDLVADYGQLIVDECHHISAASFELAARRCRARYVLGLSATLQRKDGHDPIIEMQLGPVRHRVNARTQAASRPFTHEVIVHPTSFLPGGEPESDARLEFQRLCRELISSESRNQTICDDVLAAVKAGRHSLVLTERVEHMDLLAQALEPTGIEVIRLHGGRPKRERLASSAQLATPAGESGRIVLATGRYIGEGFDYPRLDTLFLTLPVSWRGTIAQYVGRLHRLHQDKHKVQVHDYAELEIPMLARMFDRRCEGYRQSGYTILLPTTPLPGWPSEVALPVDPQWKNEYAASIRRLLRDGIQPKLAQLFVHATTAPSPNAQGADRARSASERFLLQRLQTLPATSDLFQLNAKLPIPFDDQGEMEVDFLCESQQLVIELDGHQHLDDEVAWRRDRAKDLLLQTNGYLILRFLAADLSKQLDHVLDTISRALAGRREE